MTILVGDIGGTSSRFALLEAGEEPSAVGRLQIFANAKHASLSDAIRTYLDATGAKPDLAVIDMAGPVTGEVLRLTNLAWEFSPRLLTEEFGFKTVIINDFEANACALPYLRADVLAPIGSAMPRKGAKAVLGPGTGLGVAGLILSHDLWVPVPGEAGHIELAANTAEEFAILEPIRSRFGRVSAERVLSGPGLERLHKARAEVLGFDLGGKTRAAEIDAEANAGDPQALATVRLFMKFFARFAGDVALIFAAEGGVYLHGGVAQKLSEFIDPAAFRAEFEAKAPHQRLLAGIATVLITESAPALIGCAAVALGRID